MKFKSSRLKEFNYDITLGFNEAKSYGEIIALADNQFLRSIRKIKNHNIHYELLERWYKDKNKLLKKENTSENSEKIRELQHNIDNMMFIPQYITIVIEHPSHYKHLFKNGLTLNNKKYYRLSSSAGQARESTVVFCEEETKQELSKIMNNDRNTDIKHAPSKFNAYFGLAGSATKTVSTPKFCVVPDYYSETTMKFNYVTETDWETDDLIDIREMTQEFNRFDGQGLIDYGMAKKWADELGLDYVPAQWCIRQNFIKGMLCTFPIKEYLEQANNGNYNIKTIYKDEFGNNIVTNMKDIDVILSESQFKLWDSFPNLDVFQTNCVKNNLTWGVSLYTPKETKHILRMNYQFIQTLNLNQEDIEDLCEKFVDWISGVNSENIYYTLLFLLGKNVNEEKINNYLRSSENYWVKSFILNHKLINDDYIRKKIYDMIKVKIKKACLGEIIVDGNFQTLVSDPYAMMQHVCGQEVTGLLKKNEYYSHYWNTKGVQIVDSMRAPLTYRSEHLKLHLKKSDELDRWYRYCYTGVIVNAFGGETVNWAGSDFDYDQIATTSNQTVLRGVFKDELPITYDPPKPNKIQITEEDLFQADLFSFGSAIGSITNKSTSAYALLSMFEQGSKEYNITMNRLKMCTKLQSAQIDKAKIGKNVKGIPKNWTTYQKISKDLPQPEQDDLAFLNDILLDKHPYFFIYLYGDTKKKYKKYVDGKNLECKHRFNLSVKDLIDKPRKIKEEREFIKKYYSQLPVIDSDCVMNNLCKYIESIDFSLKEKIKVGNSDYDMANILLDKHITSNKNTLQKVIKNIKRYNKKVSSSGNLNNHTTSYGDKYSTDVDTSKNIQYEFLKDVMNDVCSNREELVNYLIQLSYDEKPKFKKELLWELYGDTLYERLKKNNASFLFPFPSEQGNIEYLNNFYELREVEFE